MKCTDRNGVLELNAAFVQELGPLDEQRLSNLIDMCALSVIHTHHGQMTAFLLALREGAAYDSLNYRWFSDHFDCFLYIDRIAVAERCSGMGIGSALYRYAKAFAESNNVPFMLAEVNVRPLNEASLRFHKKVGFKELDTMRQQGGKVVSFQLKGAKTLSHLR